MSVDQPSDEDTVEADNRMMEKGLLGTSPRSDDPSLDGEGHDGKRRKDDDDNLLWGLPFFLCFCGFFLHISNFFMDPAWVDEDDVIAVVGMVAGGGSVRAAE